MANYLDEVEGKYFTDLSGDKDFQTDLVRFFSGSRYGMSTKEIKELGPKALAEKFAEHMRWQSTNEWTASQDYLYVQNTEIVPQKEIESFGSLMLAFDKSEGGGTGVLSGAWDYMSAFAASPSTAATVVTGGWGVGSKLAARATGKAIQLTLRQQIAGMVEKGIAKKAIQEKIAGTVKGGAIKGALSSAAYEGAFGAVTSALQGETREVAAGKDAEGNLRYQYGMDNLLYDGLVAGATGGVLGGGVRAYNVKKQRNTIDSLIDRDIANTALQEKAAKAVGVTFSLAEKETLDIAADRAVAIANAISAKNTRVRLNPLDPEIVEKGEVLKKSLLGGKTNMEVTTNLSLDTLRNVTAATVELLGEKKIKLGPQERISSAVYRSLKDPEGIDSEYLGKLRNKYNLSREEFSYIYLGDFSQAGKTLAEASYLKKVSERETAVGAATVNMKATSNELASLYQSGLSTISDTDAANIVASTYSGKDGVMSKIYKTVQATDATRIAFMTSQIGTTMANLAGGVYNLAVDMSDQFWKSMFGTAFGVKEADRVQRRWVGGMTSTIKGMSWGKDEANLFREVFLDERPDEYSRLFYEAATAEVAIGGTSLAAKAARGFNIFNTAVDSTFKQAALYASVDRSLMELNDPALGKNLGEFLSKNTSLDALPEDFIKKAVYDAKRFSFQLGYEGDKSAFGKISSTVIKAHKTLPFLVSSMAGIPFPRYIANHLEHVNDYTPLGIITGGLNKLDTTLYKDVKLVGGDPFKTDADRVARQITGASVIMLGVYTAAQKKGEIDYDKLKTETDTLDLSRAAGPWLMNIYIGDLIYRQMSGLPLGKIPKTIREIALGETDLGFNDQVLTSIADSYEKGSITPELQRTLGDTLATFSYPVTVARDVLGQLDPKRVTKPYTKEVFGGGTGEESVSQYGEYNFLESLFNEGLLRRATRFLPEVNFVQYTQSVNGKTAMPIYSIFSDGPVGAWNPLSSQLGFTASRKPNELQKELSRLNLREYEVYTNRDISNPAVEVIVQERLSKVLPELFYSWKSGMKHSEYGNKTYDEITDPKLKEQILKSFIKGEVKSESDFVTEQFNDFITTNPRSAAGFVRSMYVLKEAELIRASNNDAIYDTAVKTFTKGTDDEAKSAAEYIGDSENIVMEVRRRQDIINWASQFVGKNESYTRVRK